MTGPWMFPQDKDDYFIKRENIFKEPLNVPIPMGPKSGTFDPPTQLNYNKSFNISTLGPFIDPEHSLLTKINKYRNLLYTIIEKYKLHPEYKELVDDCLKILKELE